MLTRTDANLIADVRLRSDLGASTFRTDAQIRRYLNEANRQLTMKLIALYGQDYLHKTGTINTAASQASNDLPADCFQAKWFRVTLDGERINIPRASTEDMDVETDSQGWAAYGAQPKHRLQEEKVLWVPTPTAVHVVTIAYIHTAIAYNTGGTAITELSTGTDEIDGRWGWEEWVVLRAAIKIKHDQDEDSSALRSEALELLKDIENVASDRDISNPIQIRDSYGEYV